MYRAIVYFFRLENYLCIQDFIRSNNLLHLLQLYTYTSRFISNITTTTAATILIKFQRAPEIFVEIFHGYCPGTFASQRTRTDVFSEGIILFTWQLENVKSMKNVLIDDTRLAKFGTS